MNTIYLKIILFVVICTKINSNGGFAQPTWIWENNYGGTKDEYSACIKTDNNGNNYDNINYITSDTSGNNYVFGSFTGNFTLGTYNINSNGKTDVYLIKFQ